MSRKKFLEIAKTAQDTVNTVYQEVVVEYHAKYFEEPELDIRICNKAKYDR